VAVGEWKRPIRVHQLDTGLGSGNTGDDAMFMAAQAHLGPEFELSEGCQIEGPSVPLRKSHPQGGFTDIKGEAKKTPRLQDSERFVQSGLFVVNMLDDREGSNHVEYFIGHGKAIGCGNQIPMHCKIVSLFELLPLGKMGGVGFGHPHLSTQ